MNAEKYNKTRPIPELTESDKARFWSKVQKLGPDDCWEWQACTISTGYGKINIEKRACSSHRISWKISHGEDPLNMVVAHKCDNPPCCNPHHLFLTSVTGNVMDMHQKGRGSGNRTHGQDHHNAILSEADVISMREKFQTGRWNVKSLIKEYGVSDGCVRRILKGRGWKHLLPNPS